MIVPRPIRRELKYVDIRSFGNITTVGTLDITNLLNGLILGTSAFTRLGQRIQMVSLEMKVLVYPNAISTADQVFRWGIVLDRQPNGFAPGATDLVTATGANTVNVAMRTIGYGNRFRWLADEVLTMNFYGESVKKVFRIFSFFNPKDSIVSYATSNTGLVTDILTNSLWFVYSTDQTANLPFINLWFRLRYYDD